MTRFRSRKNLLAGLLVTTLAGAQVGCSSQALSVSDGGPGPDTSAGSVDGGSDGGAIYNFSIDDEPSFDGSNLADGGTCGEPALDAGEASLSGPVSFGVVSALEWRQEVAVILPDGGPEVSTAHSPSIWLFLANQAIGCDQVFENDNVDAGPQGAEAGARGGILATLWNLPTSGLESAVFPILPLDATSDAGFASLQLVDPSSTVFNPDAGAGAATSGEIQLDSVLACGLSGTFRANFSEDGGAEGPMVQGTFRAGFCAFMP